MTSIDINWNAPIQMFWEARDDQARRQIASGNVDAGTRGSVTGGRHLDALAESVGSLFRSSSLDLDVRCGGRLRLPGYYRATKDWDLVVRYRGALVAAVEFKSQSGSFGNNFNNRSEEAIGNAADIWRSYETGYLGHIRPWLGFIMVLEKAPTSIAPMRDPASLFRTDPIFNGTGYLDRYRILLQRLVREKEYDAAVVAASERGGGIYDEPVFDLSFANFEAAVRSRIAYIEALPDEAFTAPSIVNPLS